MNLRSQAAHITRQTVPPRTDGSHTGRPVLKRDAAPAGGLNTVGSGHHMYTQATAADPRTILVVSPKVVGQWPMTCAARAPVMLVGTGDLDGVTQTICRHRPTVVVEQAVASSDPGHDFIRRLQWDPSFADLDVRIIAGTALTKLMALPLPADQVSGMLIECAQRLEPLPYQKSRRIKVVSGVPLVVNGSWTIVVDLSATGVRVVSPVRLSPYQCVGLTLPDEDSRAKVSGTIIWSAFELPRSGIMPSFYDKARLADIARTLSDTSDDEFSLGLVATPHYRTGIVFANPNPEVITRFSARVQQRK